MNAPRTLQNRRGARISGLVHDQHCYRLHVGYFSDGAIAEVFIDCARPNSALDAFAADSAILISLLLQNGSSLSEIGHALRRSPRGEPASLIGAVVDHLCREVAT